MALCCTYKTSWKFLQLPFRLLVLLVLVVLIVGGYYIAQISWNRAEKGTQDEDGDGRHGQVPESPRRPAILPYTKEKFVPGKSRCNHGYLFIGFILTFYFETLYNFSNYYFLHQKNLKTLYIFFTYYCNH